jgi:FixJ family two-component response regulator
MTQTRELEQAVFVVDDDESARKSLSNLFRSVGLRVEVFGSAAELLQGKLPEIASCLVLEIRLPGISGLDFQAELVQSNIRIPVIFMTGHGDIPMSVRAMKAGAVDFLTKPFAIRTCSMLRPWRASATANVATAKRRLPTYGFFSRAFARASARSFPW